MDEPVKADLKVTPTLSPRARQWMVLDLLVYPDSSIDRAEPRRVLGILCING